ncbi:hypothetical protein BHE74_00015915 [Ensete ventricosum]|nr:hypothetical protein BHE74_00015915 [Ensete ventricosum]RZS11117.1 hypothetical protein BHM03_00042413 [Ensete ventricosum]
MSFYSGCYRSFVPEIFTASIAYHAVVLLHAVHGPWGEACVLPAAAMAYRPYPCQVGRTIAGSSMPVSGRPRRRSNRPRACGSQVNICHIIPPQKTFSRCPIRVLKIRSCAEPWVCSGVELVPKADPTEQGLGKRTGRV